MSKRQSCCAAVCLSLLCLLSLVLLWTPYLMFVRLNLLPLDSADNNASTADLQVGVVQSALTRRMLVGGSLLRMSLGTDADAEMDTERWSLVSRHEKSATDDDDDDDGRSKKSHYNVSGVVLIFSATDSGGLSCISFDGPDQKVQVRMMETECNQMRHHLRHAENCEDLRRLYPGLATLSALTGLLLFLASLSACISCCCQRHDRGTRLAHHLAMKSPCVSLVLLVIAAAIAYSAVTPAVQKCALELPSRAPFGYTEDLLKVPARADFPLPNPALVSEHNGAGWAVMHAFGVSLTFVLVGLVMCCQRCCCVRHVAAPAPHCSHHETTTVLLPIPVHGNELPVQQPPVLSESTPLLVMVDPAHANAGPPPQYSPQPPKLPPRNDKHLYIQ